MEQEATYVGIDVAKAQVDVAVRPTDDSWEVPHDQKGIRQRLWSAAGVPQLTGDSRPPRHWSDFGVGPGPSPPPVGSGRPERWKARVLRVALGCRWRLYGAKG